MSSRPHSPSQYPDITPINLNRLLSRLENTLLSPEAPSNLRKSSYERAKVGANLEHARTLLLNLEHSASTLPSKSKKAAVQSDLQQKRDLIKQLNQRLYELNQLDDSSSDDSADSEEEDADRFPSYAPRVREEAGIEVTGTGGEGNEALHEAAQNFTSDLRSRRSETQKEEAATTSGASLFPSKASTTTGDPALAHTEALLSHNRTEQEALTTSLIDMAKQLKAQSLQFGSTLESEKGILERAAEGLDRGTMGMEAAGARMGTLRRMTEGRGFFDRLKLYGMIFGLWLIAFLLVFMGPKLRF
ncbi:synaptobrevin [Clohesyomyces aquaticus]|uniref:Synaptobrevin n=1 Tax=Clohesyomyces aquaticus TaxID=1231657 RepID=A0A1Y1ZFI2_9PLEO|nr:synaptobrevin [Clohesyomyces aquaticus]